jgi:hypothetical protein
MALIYTGSNQRIPEYHTWCCLIAGMIARSYVELGCGSAHDAKRAMHSIGHWVGDYPKVVTVDILPNGLAGVDHIQGDSGDPVILQMVLEKLGEEPDVVFIDADHTEAGVTRDFNLWWPVAKMAVGFHDILMPGVIDFWAKARLEYPSVQIISRDRESAQVWQHGGGPYPDGHVNCGGIGVLFKK